MLLLTELALASYIITVVLANSQLIRPVRDKVALATPWLISPFGGDTSGAVHFVYCRLCVGAWVSILVVAPFKVELWLPVWGLSYFLARLER